MLFWLILKIWKLLYLGSSKIPTIWIYQLVKDEYREVKMFRDNDLIQSSPFLELTLTTQHIFQARNQTQSKYKNI